MAVVDALHADAVLAADLVALAVGVDAALDAGRVDTERGLTSAESDVDVIVVAVILCADAIFIPVRAALIAGIPDAVSVLVGLLGVLADRAVIANIAEPVIVVVSVALVGDRRAGVARVPKPIGVRVGLRQVRQPRAVIALGLVDVQAVGIVDEVTLAVAISVGVEAIIADVPDAVSVGVDLGGVGDRGAVIAGVPEGVSVGVGLRSVGLSRAVIILGAHLVGVEVTLGADGRVTGQAQPLGVDLLSRVLDRGAGVVRVADPVAIRVVVGVEWAHVAAGVWPAVSVGVDLRG